MLAVVVLVLTEVHERQKKAKGQKSSAKNPQTECCGQHLVCERETLLQTNAKVEYYDDEELDVLAGINAEDYTKEQAAAIREVFNTLKESDVAGWCRSMQLRNIALPPDVREEALMIVRDRRAH